jgi:hypothetical protein
MVGCDSVQPRKGELGAVPALRRMTRYSALPLRHPLILKKPNGINMIAIFSKPLILLDKTQMRGCLRPCPAASGLLQAHRRSMAH